jgi:rubrerythrin
MPKDNKARFGYQPTWDKQRKKQEAAAEEYFGAAEVPAPETYWYCEDCGVGSPGAAPRNCPECQSMNTVQEER